MNIILTIIDGIPNDPLLIKKDDTAKAVYIDLAQKLGAELVLHEIMSDSIYDIIDKSLKKTGNEIHWWETKINKF